MVYFTTRGHLFFKIFRFILEVVQLLHLHAFLNQFVLTGVWIWVFCSLAIEKFFKKPLLKICFFCELNF